MKAIDEMTNTNSLYKVYERWNCYRI